MHGERGSGVRKAEVLPLATTRRGPAAALPGEGIRRRDPRPGGRRPRGTRTTEVGVTETESRNEAGSLRKREGGEGHRLSAARRWSGDLVRDTRHCSIAEICPEEDRSVLTRAQKIRV